MIEFQLDETSGVATYLQLVQQVHQALRMGMLEEGEQLPTVKEVVAQLAINPNTVLKAYRELEHEGLAGCPARSRDLHHRLLCGESIAAQARSSSPWRAGSSRRAGRPGRGEHRGAVPRSFRSTR